MITLLFGENSFEIESALGEIVADFDGRVERIKAEDLTINQLPDILMGVSLFAERRLIVIRGLSENKSIWPILGDWLDKISDDIHLVLIESKIDKRSTTYKTLKNNANVQEFLPWNDRDYAKAEKWVIDKAKKIDLDLNNKLAQSLVRRVGPDQWRLHHAVEKLSLVDEVNEKVINDVIEPNLTENVFELFETAIRGNMKKTKSMLDTFRQTEEVYRLSALLFSQAFQLAAISAANCDGRKDDNPAKDFGIHPYVASKLQSIAKKIGRSGVRKIVKELVRADENMKSSKSDPWFILENALLKIANI
jgi:DNA polymerase III delta subunit